MAGLNIGKAVGTGRPVTIPLDFVTSTAAGVGVRGAGKTNTFVVVTEELLTNHMQVIIIDPLDVWWGLRSDATGKGAGFPIVVMGGEHGDLPLESTSGTVVAEFLVETRAPAVLSVRHMSNTAQRRFVTDFAERLYELKGKGANKSPVHIIIDEADMYCPQTLFPDVQRCFGAIDALARRGRSSGIGVSLISQRTAKINKDALSQVETMIAMRLVGPQDRKAMNDWIDVHGDSETSKPVMQSLHQLERGEGWFWSPAMDLLQRVKVRERKTFDSSATPKVGDKIIKPSVLARVDLESLKGKMASAIEQAKANDPVVLKQRIAQLEMDLKKKPSAAPAKEAKNHAWHNANASFNTTMASFKRRGVKLLEAASKLKTEIEDLIANTDQTLPVPDNVGPTPVDRSVATAPTTTNQINVKKLLASVEDKPARAQAKIEGLSRCETAILKVLAHKESDVGRLCILSGYRFSGGFKNYLTDLRKKGYITGANTAILAITAEGMEALGDNYEPLPTGQALINYWMGELGQCDRAIFGVLVNRHPSGYNKDELLEALEAAGTPYQFSGGFKNCLTKLRKIGIMKGANTAIMKASDHLFE